MPELRHCSSCHPCPRCSALSEGKEVAASRLSCFDGPPEEKTEVHVATCRHGREGDEKDRGTKRDGEQERVNPRSPAASPESEDLASRMEKISLCGGFSEQEYVGIVDLFPERITAEQEQIV
nr:hypothetical protein Iba_chr01aCG2550 [Ipomoea batatas]